MKRLISIFTEPKPWLVLFIVWLLTLIVASSFAVRLPDQAPKIPHFDKITHFGYFFGGGIILATWQLLKHGIRNSRFTRYLFPIIFFGIFGAIDEYHQTFTPGRSGNDLYDWIADFLGGALGVLIANHFHHLLIKLSSSITPKTEN